MKKIPCVFIEYSNEEQVKWWNEIGSKCVSWYKYDEVVDTTTNEPVGVIYAVKGLLAQQVINKVNSFHKETVEVVL